MTTRDEQLLWIGGGLLAGLAVWKGPELAAEAIDVIGRGDRLTVAPAGADGVVRVQPATLAAAAGAKVGRVVSRDAYALARMAESEGRATAELRMHVALNDLRELGWTSLEYLMTYSTADWARGFYGAQFSAEYEAAAGGTTWDRKLARNDNGKPRVVRAQTRRYATTRDPYSARLWIAEKVLADRKRGIDPTGGAVKFVDVSAFGAQAGTSSYEAVVAKWAKDGLRPFPVPGNEDLVLFRRIG